MYCINCYGNSMFLFTYYNTITLCKGFCFNSAFLSIAASQSAGNVSHKGWHIQHG